jgi:hypothetical protein
VQGNLVPAGERFLPALTAQSEALSADRALAPRRSAPEFGDDLDIRIDLSRYRAWQNDNLVAVSGDAGNFWPDDLVSSFGPFTGMLPG